MGINMVKSNDLLQEIRSWLPDYTITPYWQDVTDAKLQIFYIQSYNKVQQITGLMWLCGDRQMSINNIIRRFNQ